MFAVISEYLQSYQNVYSHIRMFTVISECLQLWAYVGVKVTTCVYGAVELRDTWCVPLHVMKCVASSRQQDTIAP